MPPTRLDRWSESVIETGWLAALVTAPLFFNVFSSRVFEPDKISLIRSIALIMLLAWLVKVVDGGRLWRPAYDNRQSAHHGLSGADAQHDTFMADPRKFAALAAHPWWRMPFLLPTLGLVLAHLVSTLLSVTPSVSWWGSYQRMQGTYTFLSYVIMALLLVAHLRSPAQIQRLQHTIIFTSLPIALYALIQHYGLDPVPWGGPQLGPVTARSAANAGNPIFLASYLLMALFFTVERLYTGFASPSNSRAEDPTAEKIDWQETPLALSSGVYLFVLMTQLLALFWTQSRGPMLGLLVGLYLFGLLLFSGLRPPHYRKWTAGWLGLGLAALLFLILLNTTSVAAPIRAIPSLARLSTILDLESRNARVRLLIWQGSAALLMPHEPLTYPTGAQDRFNTVRPLVGYGPEAMWVAFNRFYPPELAHYEGYGASADRAHNAVWDALVTTGIFGFVAYLALVVAIFYWALRWLGLIRNARHSLLFTSLLALGSFTFVTLFYLLDNTWRFIGIALPAGMMLGVAAYVTIAVYTQSQPRTNHAELPRQLLIITLLATFAAHFVESQFGIGVAATYTYFWIQMGTLLALGMRWAHPRPLAAWLPSANAGGLVAAPLPEKPAQQLSPRWLASRLPFVPATTMIDLLIFLTLGFLYTTYHNAHYPSNTSAFVILWSGLYKRPVGDELLTSPAIFALLLFTWLMMTTVALSTASLIQTRGPSASWWLAGYALSTAVVWGGWLIYGLIQAQRLTPSATNATLDNQLDLITTHFTLYAWILCAWILCAATVYAWPWLTNRGLPAARRVAITAPTAALLAGIIFLTISRVNLAPVRASIIANQTRQFARQNDWLSDIDIYRRALRVHTTEDYYMLLLGHALLEQAKQTESQRNFQLDAYPTWADIVALTPQQIEQMGRFDLLRSAELILQRGQQINPLNTDQTVNLARLYRAWAALTSNQALYQEMLEKSIAQYNLAVQLSPTMAHFWNEKGSTHLASGEFEMAEAAFQHSLALDQHFEETYLLLADFYNDSAQLGRSVELLEQGMAALEAHPRFQPSEELLRTLHIARQRLSEGNKHR